ncbi:MAG: hypothetical protein J5723_05860 [Ruminococcus sp.]|nr:hypothetical protein [Ruminococcus sp.]
MWQAGGQAAALAAAYLCCRTTTLIEACCEVDCGINANGRSVKQTKITGGSLLRESGSQSPCRWL